MWIWWLSDKNRPIGGWGLSSTLRNAVAHPLKTPLPSKNRELWESDVLNNMSDSASDCSPKRAPSLYLWLRWKYAILSMKAGRIVMHAGQIGPTDTAPLTWNRLTEPASGQRGNALGQENFLPPLPSLLIHWCNYILSCLDSWFWCCHLLSDVDVDHPGSSSSFSSVAGLLVANMGGGDGEVWHWVLGASGYWTSLPLLCQLHFVAYYQRDKAPICSYPSVLFSMMGTKLSGVRGSSWISCRVVIPSFQNSWNAEHRSKVCQASPSHLVLSQLAHLGLSANFMWDRYAPNAPWLDITWIR